MDSPEARVGALTDVKPKLPKTNKKQNQKTVALSKNKATVDTSHAKAS